MWRLKCFCLLLVDIQKTPGYYNIAPLDSCAYMADFQFMGFEVRKHVFGVSDKGDSNQPAQLLGTARKLKSLL